jgi:streptogramin lyase
MTGAARTTTRTTATNAPTTGTKSKEQPMLSRNVITMLGCVLPALAACAPTGEAGGMDPNIGTAIAEIRMAPPDTKCLTIGVSNSQGSQVRQFFGLTGVANSSFLLTGLAIDNDTFYASAYNVPCSQWATATPTWITANAPTAAVTYDPPVNVVIPMRANGGTSGRATVTADFPAPGGVITEFTLLTANSGPTGITSGPDGKLWVTESNTHAIVSITTSGVQTETILSGGKPTQIIAGADGNLWFNDDFSTNGIGRMAPNGVVRTFPQGVRTGGITLGGDGNVWFTNVSTSGISSISPFGVTHAFTAPGTGAGLAAGSDGRLWFTDGVQKVGAMTTAGVVTEYLLRRAGAYPASLVAGPDDNLWFTEDPLSTVGRITPTGVVTEFIVPSSKGAAHIAAGPDGNLWFAESQPAAIARITPTGTITEFKIPNSACAPSGIAAGPDSNVWFTESTCNKIGRITTTAP